MPDYSQGKIYKLFVKDLEDKCYIGSTIQDLKSRLREHRSHAKKDSKKTSAEILFQEGNDVIIELVEAYNCETHKELLLKEREWILKFPESINVRQITTFATPEERRERNNAFNRAIYHEKRDERLEMNKVWRTKNIEYVKQQQADYKAVMIACPDCQKLICRGNILRHKKSVHS